MYHLYHRNNWVGEFRSLADAASKADMPELDAWDYYPARIGVRDCPEFRWARYVIVAS
jgi:hypothetical protein